VVTGAFCILEGFGGPGGGGTALDSLYQKKSVSVDQEAARGFRILL